MNSSGSVGGSFRTKRERSFELRKGEGEKYLTKSTRLTFRAFFLVLS